MGLTVGEVVGLPVGLTVGEPVGLIVGELVGDADDSVAEDEPVGVGA